jgi:non-ribosomal peptide synthetase component F
LTTALNEIAMKNQVTINSLFQALWGILLQKYSGRDDVVFGAVVSGRTPEVTGIENMVGLFINTVPVRIKKQDSQLFAQLIRETQTREIKSKSYEYALLAEIQANSALRGNIFDHIVAFENYPLQGVMKEAEGGNEPGLRITGIESEDQTNYDLNIMVGPGKCLAVKFNFNALAYEEDFIKRLAAHLEEIVNNVVRDPDIPVGDIDMVTEKERTGILAQANPGVGGEDYDF